MPIQKINKGRPSVSMPPEKLNHYPFLPDDFESREYAILLRAKLQRAAAVEGVTLFSPTCEKANYCGSGLCPRCVRRFRGRLGKFLFKNGLHDKQWVQITVRPEAWKMPAGDCTKFTDFIGVKGGFKDVPFVKKLVRRLRTAWSNPKNRTGNSDRLIALGSIESNYDLWCNKPIGKPFHLHLAVLGLKQVVIREVTDKLAKDFGFVPPKDKHLSVVCVNSEAGSDLGKLTSYVLKQPFWRRSKYAGKEKGDRQEPRSRELLELALNYGVHGCPDRLIKIGFEYRGGKFRVSTTGSKKNAPHEKHPSSRVTKPSKQAKHVRKR